jgi:cell division septation protein DedD
VQTKTRAAATVIAVIALMLPAASRAQKPTLDRVDSLVAAGQVEEARTTLEAWKKDNERTARSTFTTARLATRAQDAEDAYLDVSLSYSGSTYAAEALLRLGQARGAAGDATQATVYLQRLIADYPGSAHRSTAEEWLARMQPSAASTPVATPKPASPKPQPPAPRPPATATPAPAPAPALARFAVQVGAFRQIAGARETARKLEKAGFTGARLITVPSNALVRVRVGKFENLADASALSAKLKAAGFSAALVYDVRSEQPARD